MPTKTMPTISKPKTTWDLFNLVRIGKVQEKQGRICPFLTSALDALPVDTKAKIDVINQFYLAENGKTTIDNQPYLDALSREYPIYSLGWALQNFYAFHPFPPIGTTGAFPAKYILIHDAHHILMGFSPDQQGEIDVCAFECGLQRGNIIPLLAQIKAFEYDFDIIQTGKAYEKGLKVKPEQEYPLLEQWDILSDLDKTMESLRQEYNLEIL